MPTVAVVYHTGFGHTKLMAEAREQAIDRMVEEARALGANAVVCVRFETMELMRGASEILCYGTAVTLEPDRPAIDTRA